MKLNYKYNVVHFFDEINYVSLFKKKTTIEKEIIILDFFIKDHIEKRQYYVAFFPNLDANYFCLYADFPQVHINESLEVLKIKEINSIFDTLKIALEVPYETEQIPRILVNEKEYSFNRKDSYLYIKTTNILKKQVYYPNLKNAFVAKQGNDYQIIQINNKLTLNYKLEKTQKFNYICINGSFEEKMKIKDKNMLKLEYWLSTAVIESYYDLKLYKIKFLLEKLKLVNNLIDEIGGDYTVVAREELEEYLIKLEEEK